MRKGSLLGAGAAGLMAALMAAAPARAWDNQGHMATGAIAYDRLMAQDPKVVAQIVALMARHPDRARFERELAGAPAAERGRLLFEYMARWPDDVGGTPADIADWHYAEQVVTPWRALFPFTFGKAEQALVREAAIAADAKAPAAARAVALCWVFHITGDMQQPLHAGTWVDGRFPLSDLGGTRAWVRPSAGAPAMHLHLFWDRAAALPEPEVQGAADLAARLERAYPADPRRLAAASPRAAFRAWAAESRGVAREVAYGDGDFPAATTAERAPVLSRAYIVRARGVAERRVALGGYRLAELLRAQLDPGA